MKQQIEQALALQLCQQFAWHQPVSLVAKHRYADYSTQIAWQLASTLGGEPWIYACALEASWRKSPWVKLELVAPGYLNFHYQPKYLAAQIQSFLVAEVKLPQSPWFDQRCQYAFTRNQGVLPHLSRPSRFYLADLTHLQWTDPEWECIRTLSKFRDLQPLQYSDYLKNLARIIHCLYNEVTLISSDVRKNQALAAVLQAAQVVLAQGFYLVGDQE